MREQYEKRGLCDERHGPRCGDDRRLTVAREYADESYRDSQVSIDQAPADERIALPQAAARMPAAAYKLDRHRNGKHEQEADPRHGRGRRRNADDQCQSDRDLDGGQTDRHERGEGLADAIAADRLAESRAPRTKLRDACHEKKSAGDEPRDQWKRGFEHAGMVVRFHSVASR